MNDPVIIYTERYGLYWRENSCGYTNNPNEAGVYERSEVEYLLGKPYEERREELKPVPENHVTKIAELRREVEELREYKRVTEEAKKRMEFALKARFQLEKGGAE